MTDELKITDTPPALHNLMWSDFPEDFQEDGAVRAIRDAHAQAEGSWNATIIGHRKVMADVTNTPDRNLQRSHEAAMRRAKEVEKTTLWAIRLAGEQIDALEAAMNKVPNPPGPHIVTLVADRMAKMDDNARHKLLTETISNDDHWTVGAALFNGPPWLYGLTQAKRDIHLARYREKTFPELVARKAAIEKAAEILTNGYEAHNRALAKLIDGKKIERAQKLAEAAEMALR